VAALTKAARWLLAEQKVDAALVTCDAALARFAHEEDGQAARSAADDLLGVAHALFEARSRSDARQRAVRAGVRAQERWRHLRPPARLGDSLPGSLTRFLSELEDERRCDQQAVTVLDQVLSRLGRDESPEAAVILTHARELRTEVLAALGGR
jgi:hypothetical protein